MSLSYCTVTEFLLSPIFYSESSYLTRMTRQTVMGYVNVRGVTNK